MFLIKSRQICAARGLLGVSQAGLAQWAGLSRGTLAAIEGGYDTKVSSLEAVTTALQARGVIFHKDGLTIALKMDWSNGKPADPVLRRRAVAGLNTARAARNQPLLVDDED
jgi:DNA-binding XRE family transcriptional regulator